MRLRALARLNDARHILSGARVFFFYCRAPEAQGGEWRPLPATSQKCSRRREPTNRKSAICERKSELEISG